jgi:adenosyl cobinamide kinase/adenosyl cobinamide phosphate guanylyltransferase
MHFVTGGAYNGKRAWVKRVFKADHPVSWLSAYENQPLPNDLTHISRDLLILEGIEFWLKALAGQHDLTQSRKIWNKYLDNWLVWEKANGKRKLVLIGTDLSKGIVPLEIENRLWRDLTGWAYQDTAAKAEKMDVIWYGINQTIK